MNQQPQATEDVPTSDEHVQTSQDVDSFEAGFNGVDIPQVEQVEQQPAEPQEEEAPQIAQITVDEYRALMEKAEQIDSLKKTIDSLNGHVGFVKQQLAQKSGLSEDDFSPEMREDFPSIVKGIVDTFSKKGAIGGSNIDLSELKNNIASELTANYRAEIEQINFNMQQNLLKTKHPDHVQVAESDDFKSWLKTRPEDEAKIFDSKDSFYVTSVLDAFKASQKTRQDEKTRRTKQLQAAVQPKGLGVASSKPQEVDPFLAGFYGQ